MPSLPITVTVSLSWSPSSLSNLALPQPFNSMWSADNFLVSSSSLCAFVPLVRKDATEVWLLSKGISLWEFGPHGEKFPWTNHHHSQLWIAHNWTAVTARWRWLLEVGAHYLCKILGYCSSTYVSPSPVALPADVCVLLVVQLIHGITTQIHWIYSFSAELPTCRSIPTVPTRQQHTLQQRCRHPTRGHPDVVSPRCALAVTRRPVAALAFCVRAATKLPSQFPDLADSTGLVWGVPAPSHKNKTQSSATDTHPIAQTSSAWWEHFGHQV